jgi:hypothetical protein
VSDTFENMFASAKTTFEEVQSNLAEVQQLERRVKERMAGVVKRWSWSGALSVEKTIINARTRLEAIMQSKSSYQSSCMIDRCKKLVCQHHKE